MKAQDSFFRGQRRIPFRREGGFTLVELLVVIAIIGVLAAMLLPALARGKAQAYNAVCKGNLHHKALALQMYADDNNHTYPYLAPYGFLQSDVGPDVIYESEATVWNVLLSGYEKVSPTNPANQCPIYMQHRGIVLRPSTDAGSYAINSWGMDEEAWGTHENGIRPLGLASPSGPGGVVSTGWRIPAVHDYEIVAPGEMFAMGDSREYYFPTARYEGSPLFNSDSSWASLQKGFSMGRSVLNVYNNLLPEMLWDEASPTNELAPPHAQGYNVAHADGHVALITRRNLYYPPVAASHWNNDHQPHQEYWNPKSDWVVPQ